MVGTTRAVFDDAGVLTDLTARCAAGHEMTPRTFSDQVVSVWHAAIGRKVLRCGARLGRRHGGGRWNRRLSRRDCAIPRRIPAETRGIPVRHTSLDSGVEPVATAPGPPSGPAGTRPAPHPSVRLLAERIGPAPSCPVILLKRGMTPTPVKGGGPPAADLAVERSAGTVRCIRRSRFRLRVRGRLDSSAATHKRKTVTKPSRRLLRLALLW
jgi:hypothetical protein